MLSVGFSISHFDVNKLGWGWEDANIMVVFRKSNEKKIKQDCGMFFISMFFIIKNMFFFYDKKRIVSLSRHNTSFSPVASLLDWF